MSKEIHTTTNMYRKPEGRKVGAYFKGKTESCNREPHAAPSQSDHVDTPAERAAEHE